MWFSKYITSPFIREFLIHTQFHLWEESTVYIQAICSISYKGLVISHMLYEASLTVTLLGASPASWAGSTIVFHRLLWDKLCYPPDLYGEVPASSISQCNHI